MSRLGQDVLVSLLTDKDSLVVLAKEGLPLECIPTADLRPVVEWALAHYRTTGEAPTPAVMREEHGNVLDDNEIDPGGVVEEVIEWALDDLRADYVRNEAGKFSRELVQRMTECAKAERMDTLGDMASQLSALVTVLQPKTTQVDMRSSGEEMLQDYLYRASHPGEIVGLTLGMPMVDTYTGGIHPGELAVIGGGPKTGKATAPDEPVLTRSGWVKIKDIEPGQEVIGSNGRPTRVLAKHVWSDRPVMKVTTDDGGSVVVDEAHEWTITPHGKRSRVIETQELAQRITTNKRFAYLPVVQPVQYAATAYLALDPYLLGAMLGDGGLTSTTPTFSKPDQFMHDEIDVRLPEGDIRRWAKRQRGMASIVGGRTTKSLREMGLWGCHSWDKFIPEQYLRASVLDRSLLLAGLLDTDGGVQSKSVTFCSTSEVMANQVRELVLSLGGTARIKCKPEPKFQDGGVGRPAWVVILRLPFNPFRLPRKRDAYDGRGTVNSRPPSRRIVSVEPAGRADTVCIQVEAEDGLYVTNDFIVTHNSWMMNFVAYHQWLDGKPTALFTLENSIKMTEMRLACIALHISSTELQTGTLSAEDLDALQTWVNDELKTSAVPLHILSPEGSQRTPQALVQTARASGAESLIIDQLSYMKAHGDRRLERRDEIASILRDLSLMIETGRQPMSCLLAHQINREGVKASMATGRLYMHNFADGSEVERVVTYAGALFRSEDMVATSAAQLQTLAFRRGPVKHYDLLWDIDAGHVMARNEVELVDL
jgi:replicative DNA helicase